ncbi:MAG: chemotaxis protein, partial [Deltaproteobacteria bacterium]|nr:chemotaxis protein [Deltaproteobacteria bacterium]
YVDRISKGDIPEKITDEYKGDFNEIKNNLNQAIDAINGLVAEAAMLADAAARGDVDTRGDAAKYGGDFGAIVQGMNNTMEGVAVPLKDIGDTLDRLAAGDSKAQVTADYKGAYNVLKVAANALGDQIGLVVQEMEKLAAAAAEGNLDYRGDPSKMKGDGANRTMEGVVVPIKETLEVLESVANRDLTKQILGAYKGEYDRLKRSTNTAIENLHDALSQAGLAAEQVGSASGQVASSSQELAEGSSEQASSLEETSSSLEEMGSMTKQNADNANQANNLMENANQIIQKANESMGDLTTSMEDISKASEETSKIIKTIDEIAFQTNLLALNAAVEAARAGEAGAGFAVVADEVRNLALRAADAAKNTAGLIEDTVKKVGAGGEIVSKTNEAFTEVATAATKVGELVGEIAAASQEQNKGIDQVNQAVAEMDKVTQANAANAEESASASEEMSAQAQELQGMLAEFKLKGQDSGRKQKALDAPKEQRAGNLKKAAHAGKKAKGEKAKAKEVTADKIIPMDDDKADDAGFKDF